MTLAWKIRTPHTVPEEALAPGVPVDTPPRSALEIHKLGGSALADGPAIARAVELLAGQPRGARVVVVSALGGVTDALVDVARGGAEGADSVVRIRDRHLEAAAATSAGEACDATCAWVDDTCRALAALVATLPAEGARGPLLDEVLAFGERLAAVVLHGALAAAGVAAEIVDGAAVVWTDGRPQHAAPDVARTGRAARRLLRPLLARGVLPVVSGFIGRGADGRLVTLGRGGTDLTATLLARALDARRVVLWKDVPGILTADPLVVPDARLIPQLDVREAAALASLGAKVLHERALVPLRPRTRVVVRPVARPDAPGTEILAQPRRRGAHVKAIAAIVDQALVTVSASGFSRVGELGARVLAIVNTATARASLLGHSAAERRVSLTMPLGDVPEAVAALRSVFSRELSRGVLVLSAPRRVSTIGIVGTGVGGDTAVVTRAFAALDAAAVPMLATVLAPGELALTVVVDAEHGESAQRALHAAFELQKTGGGRAEVAARADVVLLGVGAIGRELLTQLSAGRAPTDRLRVCGLVDTSGFVFDPGGLARARLAEAVAHKTAGGRLAALAGGAVGDAADAIAHMATHALVHPVLVDATAAPTGELLERVAALGWGVVLANKVPLAGEQAAFDRLHRAAHAQGRVVLHEATVGAGLPVIDTLRKLQEAGDRVLRIEGCPSGTLGFVFGELGRGTPFSAAVQRAVEAGYAEPDPRVDLSGLDVARKALILARLIGFRGSLDDVRIESLIPPALATLPLAEFVARLPELDGPWAARVEQAREQGRVLRYRARVSAAAIDVSLVAVGPADPLSGLHGTDNQFAFTTTRYRAQPLVITGPGAGAAVTAAGVYNDLLRTVAEHVGPRARPRPRPRVPA